MNETAILLLCLPLGLIGYMLTIVGVIGIMTAHKCTLLSEKKQYIQQKAFQLALIGVFLGAVSLTPLYFI